MLRSAAEPSFGRAGRARDGVGFLFIWFLYGFIWLHVGFYMVFIWFCVGLYGLVFIWFYVDVLLFL